MSLLFDLIATQPSREAKFHGGGRYAEEVFFRMIELNQEFACVYDSTKYLNPEIKDSCAKHNIQLFDINLQNLDFIVKQHNINVLYSALPSFSNVNDFPDCVIIGTIHGIRELETPINRDILNYDFDIKLYLKYCLKVLMPRWYNNKLKNKLNLLFNDERFKFVTVSNHSKYSIMSFFPTIKEQHIAVFYSPSTVNKFEEDEFIVDKKEPYFLLVSGNRWIKNTYRAIRAFDILFSERPYLKHKVIITGVSKRSKLRKLVKNKSSFIFYEYLNENILAHLYKDAYCLVYPSINEGFGYPPIEAMSYGTPVICSSVTSISEICGDASLYFNPFSIVEIKSRILMMLNTNIRTEYSSKALKRYEIVFRKQQKDLDDLIDYIFLEVRNRMCDINNDSSR